MIVLGVDVGLTTGLAIVSEDDQRILLTSVADEDSLAGILDTLIKVVDEVVVERALIHKRSTLGSKLEAVHRTIAARCPDAYWIDASLWKNTAVSRTPVPRGLSTHERDAVRIARYYCTVHATSVLSG
jgi:hypothetical protein